LESGTLTVINGGGLEVIPERVQGLPFEISVSLVQFEGNRQYREIVYGTPTPSEQIVRDQLSDGLIINNKFKVPRRETNSQDVATHYTNPNGDEIVLDSNSMGVLLVLESDYNSNRYGIQQILEDLTPLTGNLAAPAEAHCGIYYDKNGHMYFVYRSHSLSLAANSDFYTEERLFGGFESAPSRYDKYLVTAFFETVLNVLRQWPLRDANGNIVDGPILLSPFYEVDEYIALGGSANTRGTLAIPISRLTENELLFSSVVYPDEAP
ncbi:MAG: hypothetical protein KDE09_16020, partial [Anaerolineales bacterium]|nr:hypothetical protein [Anaerolineales bacterium]